MALTAEFKGTAGLLCEKGLARKGILIPREDLRRLSGEWMDAPEEAVALRKDESVITEVFRRRFEPLETRSGEAVGNETEHREGLLWSLVELYFIGRERTPRPFRRELQPIEVDAAITALRRVAASAEVSWHVVIESVRQEARQDEDPLAHVMDPFQLRFVLSHSRDVTLQSVGATRLAELRRECLAGDRTRIRAWFEQLFSPGRRVPTPIAQLLRRLLLDLWRQGKGDLGMLAHEIAALDTVLLEELGWESTRVFCAQLRRITGPGSEALDAFLSDEDVDCGLVIAERLRQAELAGHFRRLAATYNTTLHRNVRRSVRVVGNQWRQLMADPAHPLPELTVPQTRDPFTRS